MLGCCLLVAFSELMTGDWAGTSESVIYRKLSQPVKSYH